MKCLVTGAYGFLGSSLCDYLENQGHEVTRASRRASAQLQLDPSDSVALLRALERFSPNVLINLIAMTNIDSCERDPAKAYRVNAGVVQSIGTALQCAPSVHLIHLSTDQVYDGPGPHAESCVAPANVYAITKLAGEMLAERQSATVLRVNFIGRSKSPGCASLTDWIVDSLLQRKEITLFNDVFFSPLHLSSLSEAIESVLTRRIPGIFNLGARGGVSKAELGITLADRLGLPRDHVALGSVKTAQMEARRPKDMVMDSMRFEQTFGYKLPRMDDEITRSASDYKLLLGGAL